MTSPLPVSEPASTEPTPKAERRNTRPLFPVPKHLVAWLRSQKSTTSAARLSRRLDICEETMRRILAGHPVTEGTVLLIGHRAKSAGYLEPSR